MVKQKWERHGRRIKDLETGEEKFFEAINEAKRESRRLQLKNSKALGRGDLRTIK